MPSRQSKSLRLVAVLPPPIRMSVARLLAACRAAECNNLPDFTTSIPCWLLVADIRGFTHLSRHLQSKGVDEQELHSLSQNMRSAHLEREG